MKPKPQIRLSLTKETLKKPQMSIQTPQHKYTSSAVFHKSLMIPTTTKAKSSISTLLGSTSSKPALKIKHHHTMSQQIPLSTPSQRLIKIPKLDSIEDKELWKSLPLPTTPSKIIELFKIHLSSYEQTEIANFPDIYFIGLCINKIRNSCQQNSGYDDDAGDYKIIIGDHIAYRYEIISSFCNQ